MPRDLRSLQYPRDFMIFALSGLENRINWIEDEELKDQLLDALFDVGQTIANLSSRREKLPLMVEDALQEFKQFVHSYLESTVIENDFLLSKAEVVLNRILVEENQEDKNEGARLALILLLESREKNAEITEKIRHKLSKFQSKVGRYL